jgi:hypothetical protein
MQKSKTRPISDIAIDIMNDWDRPYFGAVPYVEAMQSLNSINDMYGYDSAEEIVLRFLVNAGSWRGPEARRIKKELNDLLKTAGRR